MPHDTPRANPLAVLLVLSGLAMAVGLWAVDPLRWLGAAAAAIFFVILAVVLALDGPRSRTAATPLGDAVAIGALIVILPLALTLAAAAGVLDGAELRQRVTMATLGVYLVLSGNAIPKRLLPLAPGRDAARIQARQRFCGWTWTLAGLGYVLAWLLLPMSIAAPVSMASVGGGLLLVAGRTWRQRIREGRT